MGDAYWHGLLWGLRNTVLSLIPVVLGCEPLMEALAILLIPLASLALQCRIKPWCTRNLVDAAVTFPVILCSTAVISLVPL